MIVDEKVKVAAAAIIGSAFGMWISPTHGRRSPTGVLSTPGHRDTWWTASANAAATAQLLTVDPLAIDIEIELATATVVVDALGIRKS